MEPIEAKKLEKHGGEKPAQQVEQTDQVRKVRLQECESVLERGRRQKSTFMEQGAALLEIRKNRLYREKGYNTFETYCNEEWGFTRQRASQLILAFKFDEETSTGVDSPTPDGKNKPTNERAARKKRRQKQNGGANANPNPNPKSQKEELFVKIERWSMELNIFLRKLTTVEDQKSAYRKLDPIIEWAKVAEAL